MWGGLSGALVFHAGRAVGVMVEHHPRQGSAAVQLIAFDSVAQSAETDEAARRVADALGLPAVGAAGLGDGGAGGTAGRAG